MSSIRGGMSVSRLQLRTSVSRLFILLMFSGSFSSRFLCSHRVCSVSILRTNPSVLLLMVGGDSGGRGLRSFVHPPVYVFG